MFCWTTGQGRGGGGGGGGAEGKKGVKKSNLPNTFDKEGWFPSSYVINN